MITTVATADCEYALACAGISKTYDTEPILRDITLQLPRGCVLGLLGRNGAGKSTLIRILLGLQTADWGESRVLGERSLALTDTVKERVGFVPQQPDALGWMRVGDMFDFVGRLYPRWDAGFVERSLLRWQLPPSRVLSRLSPGERQRVAFIRALAVNPDLLVLDEPAAALDPVARRDMLREIAQRAGETGTTVLFSTHIVSDLERIASHVAILHESRIMIDCAADELSDTYARLTVPADACADVPASLPGEVCRRRRPEGGLSLVVSRDRPGVWPLVDADPRVRVDRLALEDLFIEVAG